MRKWMLLAALAMAAGGAAYLHHSGQFDLLAAVDKGGKHIRELTGTQSSGNSETEKQDTADHRSNPPPAVTVATAARNTFVSDIMVTGSLVAREEILIAPEVDGLRVLTLAVDEGDRVEKGGLLATLEEETLQVEMARNDANLRRAEAALAQATSRVNEAEAVLEEADAQLARAVPLKDRKILSESVYDQRRAAATTARAQVATARDGIAVAEAEKAELQARRREIEWRLAKTEIRSPAAGLVTRRTARIGSLAMGAASPLFRLARDGEIELEATVTEPKLAKIAVGQKAAIRIAGIGDVSGTVRLISPEIDPATRLGKVRVFLGNSPQLRIGAFGRATIHTEESEGISVPLSAILFDGRKAFVQVVDNGRVKTVAVTVGLTADGRAEIESGLGEGDVVVAKAGTFLRDGDEVRPVATSRKLSQARP